MLTEFDYAIFAIVAFFTIRGFFSGFIAQISSLTGWFFAAWLSNSYSGILCKYVPSNWPGGYFTQRAVAIFLIFSVTLLIFSSLGIIVRRLIDLANLREFDSILGCLFGAIRSMIVILLVFIFAHITPLPKYLFWQRAFTRPVVESILFSLKPHLPKFLNELISITLNMDESKNN